MLALLLAVPLAGVVAAPAPTARAATAAAADAGSTIGQTPALWPHAAQDVDMTYVALEQRGSGVKVQRIPKGATKPDATNILNAPGRGAFGGGPDGIDIAAVGGHVYVAWTQMYEPDPGLAGQVEVWVAVSRDSGGSFGTPLRLSDVGGAAAWGPKIAADGFRVVVTWAEDGLQVAASENAGGSYVVHRVASTASPYGYDIAIAGRSAYVAYIAGDHLEMKRSTDGGQVFSAAWTGPTAGTPKPPVVAATPGGAYLVWGTGTTHGDGTYSGTVTATTSTDAGKTWEDVVLAECQPARNVTCDSYNAAVHDDKVFLATDTGPVGDAHVVGFWSQADGSVGGAIDMGAAFDVSAVDVAADALGMYVGWSATNAPTHDWRTHVSTRLHAARLFATTTVNPDPPSGDYAPALSAYDGEYGLAWMRVTSESGSNPLEPSVRFARGPIVDGDLEMVSAEAVQGPYGVERLVAGKPAVARVRVRSGLLTSTYADISLTYAQGGGAGTTVTTKVFVKPGGNTFFLPETQPFSPAEGELTVTAHIDPSDEIQETDEFNNGSAAKSYRVKQTRPFRILVVPFKSGDESAPSCAEVQTVAFGVKQYVSGAYPLDPSEVTVDDNCARTVQARWAGPYDSDFGLGMAVLGPLDSLNAQGGYDQVVGVGRPGWFKDNWKKPEAIGISHVGSFRRAALVDASAHGGSVAAHEILHRMGWVHPDTPGHDAEHPNHMNAPANGYWVDRRQEMNRNDLMSAIAPAPATPDDTWVSPATWDFLMDQFATDPVDPPLVWLDGAIGADGKVTTGTWYETEGFLDAELGDTGDLSIRYLAADGSVLARTAVDTANALCDDAAAGATCTSNSQGFAARIPNVAGTTSIELVRDGDVLYRRDRTAAAPTVTVTSPSAGAKLAAGSDVKITWAAADADGDPLSFAVAVSTDAGTTWRPIASDVRDESLTVRAAHEFTGADVRVRVSASDGWNTTHATSQPFAVKGGVTNGDLVFTKAVSGSDRGEIWRTDESGTDQRMTAYTERPGGFAAGYPDWSPDGSRVAFLARATDGRYAIYDMDRSGGDRRELALSSDALKCTDWSPDGKRVLSLRSQQDNRTSVVTFDTTTGAAHVITTGAGWSCPHWSPDGSRVVFSAAGSDGWTQQVYVADVATGTRTLLTTGGASTHGNEHRHAPSFSPDGSSIAYLSYGFGEMFGQKVWVMNADGSNARVLGPANACSTCPGLSVDASSPVNWAPDGGAIVFTYPTLVTATTMVYDVWSIPPAGGTATRLTANPGTSSYYWTQGDLQPVLPSGDGNAEVAPPVVADAGGPYDVVEGASVVLDASASSVASGSPLYTWDLDGDGQYDDADGATPSMMLSGSGDARVAVRVADASGSSATASAVVRVANAAPVLRDIAAVADGGRVSVSGVVADAGSDDTHKVVVEWADGAKTEARLARTSEGSTFYAGHDYGSSDATLLIRVVAHDSDGASAESTARPVAAPENRRPTISGVSAETREGVPLPLTFDAADADGNALTLRVVTPPAHGSVVGDGVPIIPGTGAQLTYAPKPGFSGTDTFTVVADDGRALSERATVTVLVKGDNNAPSCTDLRVTPDRIWPANTLFVPVTVSGATDADGDALSTSVAAVTQDEAVGREADARRASAPDSVLLRAERDGRGDGRVYRLTVEVSDAKGGTCTGTVVVRVPHDEYADVAVDSGKVFDSFGDN